jgi:hypothetical protein
MPTVKAPATVSADTIAFQAIKTWDIPVTGKDVRGLARGDSGPAVLPRFAERNADGTNRVHQYTAQEAGIVVRALAARKARRVPTVSAAPLLKALGLPVGEVKVTRKATVKAPATAPKVNRALGQRAVKVKAPTAPQAPATAPDAS